MQTRRSNPQSHPGQPDAPKKYRSSEEVALDKALKVEAKSKEAATKAAKQQRVAAQEAAARARAEAEKGAEARPSASTKKKAKRTKAKAKTSKLQYEKPPIIGGQIDTIDGHHASIPKPPPAAEEEGGDFGEFVPSPTPAESLRADPLFEPSSPAPTETEAQSDGLEPMDIDGEIEEVAPAINKRKAPVVQAQSSTKKAKTSAVVVSTPAQKVPTQVVRFTKPHGRNAKWHASVHESFSPSPPSPHSQLRPSAGSQKLHASTSSSSSRADYNGPPDYYDQDPAFILKEAGFEFVEEDFNEGEDSLKEALLRRTSGGRSTSKTMIKIEKGHTSGTGKKSSDTPKKAFGLSDLPSNLQAPFTSELTPLLIQVVGDSKSAWERPSVALIQKAWNKTFPSTHVTLNQKSGIVLLASQYVYAWRNTIGSTAIEVVTAWFDGKRFEQAMMTDKDCDKVPDPRQPSREQKIQDWVKMATQGVFPFIWKVYGETPLPGKTTHARSGRYQSEIILKTFTIHFGTKGIARDPTSIKDRIDSGHFPITALALCVAAVERAIHMYRTGRFVKSIDSFCEEKWGDATQSYVKVIAEKVTADNWIEILGGVRDEFEKVAKTRKGRSRRVVKAAEPAYDPRANIPSSDPLGEDD